MIYVKCSILISAVLLKKESGVKQAIAIPIVATILAVVVLALIFIALRKKIRAYHRGPSNLYNNIWHKAGQTSESTVSVEEELLDNNMSPHKRIRRTSGERPLLQQKPV